jgi:hypothetical protein
LPERRQRSAREAQYRRRVAQPPFCASALVGTLRTSSLQFRSNAIACDRMSAAQKNRMELLSGLLFFPN